MARSRFLNFNLDSQPEAGKKQRRTWRPGEVPNWVLLIDGQYNVGGMLCQGHPYTMHFVGKGRSGGFFLTHRDDGTCVPCYEINRNNAKNISISRKVFMTAFWPGWFHLVEKQGDYGVYKQKELCRKPQFCQYCNDTNAEEATYGRRLAWGMSSNDAEILSDRAIEIAKMCKGCGGEVYPLAIVCQSCGHKHYDLTRIAMEHGDIMNLLDEERKCPSCQSVSYPVEILKCSNGCTTPSRASIFDVLLKVKTIRTGKNDYPQLSIVEHSKPITLDEILDRDEALETFEAHLVEPIDPSPYIDPESAAEQAAKIGCQNPYAEKGARAQETAPAHRPYRS